MKHVFLGIGVLLLLDVSTPGAAKAQSAGQDLSSASNTTPDIFSRNNDVSVRERPRPEYDPIGVRFGQFLVLPKIEFDASYDDNIYANNANKVADEIVDLKPAISAQSDWVRHSLALFADADRSQYLSHAGESTTDWDVGFNGRLDITRDANFSAGASASHLTEARETSGTPVDAAQPVQYNYDQFNVNYLQTFDRFRASLRVDEREFNYSDVPSMTGGTIDETFRDRTEGYYTLRADYAESPAVALYLQMQFNTRDYSHAGTLTEPSRTSQGYEALGGANFEITDLVRGEIGAGYLEQSYSTKLFAQQSGFGVRAKVDWFWTPLTTVNLVVSRGIEDPGVPNSAGGVVENAQLTADHELLRNLIISANVGYANETYNGIQRTDDRWRFGVSATWLVNGLVGLNLAIDRFTQTSSGSSAGPDFDDDRAMLGLVLHY